MRSNFSRTTRIHLEDMAGGRCANPSCRILTRGPAMYDERAIPIGHGAHIHAAAPKGPRGRRDLTPEQIRALENGVWLCPNCATIVDRDVHAYSVDVLQGWQRRAEDRARAEMHKGLVHAAAVDPVAVSKAAGAFLQRVKDLGLPAHRLTWQRGISKTTKMSLERFIRDTWILFQQPEHPLHGLHPELVQLQKEAIRLLRMFHDFLARGDVYRDTANDGYLWRITEDPSMIEQGDQILVGLEQMLSGIRDWRMGNPFYGNLAHQH